jgi:hypothetical protein
MMTTNMLFFLTLLVLAYFLPTGLALLRAHPQGLAIFVLNLFGGWMALGWIVALVWACTTREVREVIVVPARPSPLPTPRWHWGGLAPVPARQYPFHMPLPQDDEWILKAEVRTYEMVRRDRVSAQKGPTV